MTRICFVGVCFLLGLSEIAGCTALVQSAEAALSAQQSRVRLFISCDIDCTWTIDGAHHGALKKDQEDRLDLPLGKHKLEATSSHGQRRAETLDISAPTEEHIEITFVTNSPLIDQASVAAATEINPSQPVKPPAEQSSEADSAGIPGSMLRHDRSWLRQMSMTKRARPERLRRLSRRRLSARMSSSSRL